MGAVLMKRKKNALEAMKTIEDSHFKMLRKYGKRSKRVLSNRNKSARSGKS
jgi:hypothetical protein